MNALLNLSNPAVMVNMVNMARDMRDTAQVAASNDPVAQRAMIEKMNKRNVAIVKRRAILLTLVIILLISIAVTALIVEYAPMELKGYGLYTGVFTFVLAFVVIPVYGVYSQWKDLTAKSSL